jgi:hypothetical protein
METKKGKQVPPALLEKHGLGLAEDDGDIHRSGFVLIAGRNERARFTGDEIQGWRGPSLRGSGLSGPGRRERWPGQDRPGQDITSRYALGRRKLAGMA